MTPKTELKARAAADLAAQNYGILPVTAHALIVLMLEHGYVSSSVSVETLAAIVGKYFAKMPGDGSGPAAWCGPG